MAWPCSGYLPHAGLPRVPGKRRRACGRTLQLHLSASGIVVVRTVRRAPLCPFTFRLDRFELVLLLPRAAFRHARAPSAVAGAGYAGTVRERAWWAEWGLDRRL